MTHDYWIGDRVWIASLQQEGIFEGEEGDQAIVKLDGKKQMFPFSDISLQPEKEEDFLLQELSGSTQQEFKPFEKFPDAIDLHIEVLNPSLLHAEPAQILAHQRTKLKEYLRAAIERHKRSVTVIHGKGEGVLRSEVLQLLKDFPEARGVTSTRDEGAVVVQINYK